MIAKIVADEVAAGTALSRIIIGGFSQGGALALTAALKMKGPVAAACCFSCWAPPSANLSAEAERLAKTPAPTRFLLCHGSVDRVVETQCGEQAHQMLVAAGLAADLKIYPIAHSSSKDEMDDLIAFLDDVFTKNT
jgi:predicted esterase